MTPVNAAAGPFFSLKLAAILAWALVSPCAMAAPQAASFNSLDGTVLTAVVFQPEESSKGAVIALHGCGGLSATRGARRGLLNARHQAMADLLVAQGYSVVFPDSLTPRGESELCTQKIGTRKIDQIGRRADALGTLVRVAPGKPFDKLRANGSWFVRLDQ